MASSCSIDTQKAFGPANPHCYGGFDFTLFFEEVFLSIIPFIVALPFLFLRLYKLHKASIKASGRRWHFAKQSGYLLYGAVQLISLGAMAMPETVKTRAKVACTVFSIIATGMLGLVSHFEHYRSLRPSTIITTYLTVSAVFDAARTRTLWATNGARPLAIMLLIATLIKVFLLGLELKGKQAWLIVKESSPEATSGFFSRLTFWWINPMLLRGYRTPLQESGLFELQPALVGEKELLGLFEKWETSPYKTRPNGLFFIAVRHHWRTFASAILPRMCATGFNFSQPFLLERVLSYLTKHDYANRKAVGYGLIAAYVLVYSGYATAGGLHQHRTYRSIAKLRGTLVGLLYRKTLTLSSSALKESEAVTLMNADVERITAGLRQVHELWASLFEIALSVWLLYRQIRWAALVPLGVIFACTGAAIGASPKLANAQKAWLDRIQTRIDATASMLGAMKGIKMTGLTPHLANQIRNLREKEITTSRRFRALLVRIVALSFTSTSLSPVFALGTYIMLAKYQGYAPLDTSRALTSLVLLQLLMEPVAFFITSLSGLITAMGCFERIRIYLNIDEKAGGSSIKPIERPAAEEFDFAAEAEEEKRNSTFSNKKDCIVAHNASCGWDLAKPPSLRGLNFTIKEGSLVMIVGPVSSGKSTLLKALLGEMPTAQGFYRSFSNEIAYCAQNPWLVNGTVKENIIHDTYYDRSWYNTVLQACDLETDLSQMPLGDDTVVGSKGLSLSGGQQARVTMARALYFRKSLVMFDDSLSGLDASTEEQVFESILGDKGLLRKTDTTIILVTNSVHRLSQADHIIALDSKGTIGEQGTFEELYLHHGYVRSLCSSLSDHSIYRQEKDEKKETLKGFGATQKVEKELTTVEDSTAAGDLTIYKYYIHTFGWTRWVIFCFFCALYGFGTAFPNLWVKWWAKYNTEHPNTRITYYLSIYAMLGVLAISSLVLACSILIMKMVPESGRKLHQRLLDTVLNAPMSFFAATDTGVTTNRFSQDLELIDMELPVSLVRTAMMAFVLIAQLLVIVTASKYIGAAMPFCLVVVYMVQKFYLRTSRRLRLLDIETKAHLFTHFLELLSGLVTIRAYQWERQHLTRFLEALARSQKPFYLLYCIQRWLNLVLDLIVGTIAVILVIIAVGTKGASSDPGLIGLALANLVGFSQMLKQLITNWTLLETSMGALARVRSFTEEVKSENLPHENHSPPDQWPMYGAIEFQNITASHQGASRPTLDNVNLNIAPGTKIALCGRSGSGKSSLIASLLRLLDLSHGKILIDGVDISDLPRQDVRSRIIALPQDPYVLSGSIRDNVDPLHVCSDQEIVAALEKVELSHILMESWLDDKLTSDMLSHGQCQLLCLARAMVRKGSILVLDEATASVDVNTDALMQRLIRTEFAHCTIIAAAHRLDTIIDFDAVAILNRGKLVEYDSPQRLLSKESAFKELYQIQKGETQSWDASVLTLLENVVISPIR
ncbi:P-loop containing nucleoside triphosphate hydrolase protein [Mytilinidion resinicola]|uniref:P-loop containing nucleoside triphosphate hydrolase protein n=1 Tax=Mytilinidion resinicola TaxID=574789 RepID=A0A6A6YYJ8_9PEZI|nr:P-loop containing nucleoside triphosphate hydrolase protein [Mytilinidion resinicola]KAF2814016.1 P-loop containing nucleoside triphosphate hydrolase protein [Mytilinidion resinicola]